MAVEIISLLSLRWLYSLVVLVTVWLVEFLNNKLARFLSSR